MQPANDVPLLRSLASLHGQLAQALANLAAVLEQNNAQKARIDELEAAAKAAAEPSVPDKPVE